MGEFSISSGGVDIAGDDAGEGVPVVLLHGLTATRRYVVMGSRALERRGHRVVAYDARGHGVSAPAGAPDEYGYDVLARDLLAVMDALGIERAVLAGASMGAHTSVRAALEAPDRVAGLVIATPAFDPERPADLERWDRLSEGLRSGGVEGFVAAYGDPPVPERFKETVGRILRQRLGAHAHPEALADALRAVPRSAPFEAWVDLAAIDVPTTVVPSRDAADPEHPFEVGQRYAEAIPGAHLVTEDEGSSPLAWQGAQLSKVIADVVARAA